MHTIRVAVCSTILALLVVFAGCNSAKKPSQNEARNISGDSMTGPIRYLALGDSTGAGVGARDGGYVARIFTRIVDHRPGSALTNLCVSGATTSDVLLGQLDRGVNSDPQLVTLGIGINDIGHGVTLEQFSTNFEEILTRLKRQTKAAIVVTNLPDISSAPRIPLAMRNEYHQQIVAFNQRLQEIASRQEVSLFDIYSATHEQLSSHPEFFSSDGFHPSDAGYELWAVQMWPLIALTIGAS
ncbi:MAG: SGNH/GDSL hydrolase family protein [Pyrinomonadaceae bacterium]|nr:SGNH/GDSL hydrolase family protein [Pyrinomonadaceae bacterium]